jgi:predicted alpha/beta-fold hydrolase
MMPAARPEPDAAAYAPPWWLSNGHVMTVYVWARRRTFPALPAPVERLFRVDAESHVLAHCFWQPEPAGRPTLIALHGLEGSHRGHYMTGLADKAWRRGWNAVLLNQRNCGGTEPLSPRLYHSGLTTDTRVVIEELTGRDGLRDIGLVGYSLGGNLALKLAGELGASGVLPVRGVVGVSPTIDLERCVQAIERRVNTAYHLNFVRQLRARMRRMAEAWPGRFDTAPLDRIWTIRRFDDVYTAPHHGFGDARHYYAQASALRVIDRVRVPALVIAAADDPVVPGSQFREAAVRDNPSVAVRLVRRGGHCGFFAGGRNGEDGYWAESTAVAFLSAAMPR